ncbi:hypothetical protein BDN71DRAFT_1440732, partial [Pleurotus eryngii]
SATVGASLVKELKVGISTPESWNDFKLPSLCLYELLQTRPNPNLPNPTHINQVQH